VEALLVDDGDLTEPAQADRIDAWMAHWAEAGETLGATCVRVQVGRAAPTPEVIAACSARLAPLAAAHPDVRIVIENDKGTMRNAEAVQALLEATGGAVGLLLDLGNWTGQEAEENLARVAPLAETCHAKCRFIGSEPDGATFRRTLCILKDAGYRGPLSLIYDGQDDDEWAKLDVVAALCQEVFGDMSTLPVSSLSG
jgi:sugar phosphate isomerase/epimerase